jgi:hypothetical protein
MAHPDAIGPTPAGPPSIGAPSVGAPSVGAPAEDPPMGYRTRYMYDDDTLPRITKRKRTYR